MYSFKDIVKAFNQGTFMILKLSLVNESVVALIWWVCLKQR